MTLRIRQAYRRLVYVIQRFILGRKYLLARSDYFGALFNVRIEDVIGRHIFVRGAWEPELTKFLCSEITPESTKDGEAIIDIGANIGWYSVLLDKLSSSDTRIYAFEPDPHNFSLLEKNLARNKCRKVTAVPQAVF